MRHFLYVVCTILFAACNVPLHGQPRIMVEGGTNLDFGTINRGDVIKKKIVVRNTGTDTLILRRVVPSCGCTGAVAAGDHILPGQSGSVDITFNSQNFTGAVHKTVSIETNVPDSPQTVIAFTATIVDEITLTPANCFLKDAVVGKPAALTIVVKNSGKGEFTLTGYTTDLAGFKLKLPGAPIKTGQSAEIKVTFTPTKAVPVLYESALVKTSNPRRPELYLPIYGNVREAKPE